MSKSPCPMCTKDSAAFHRQDGIDFFECQFCDFIFPHRNFMTAVDNGENIRKYDDSYWQMEVPSARQRCFGASLARVAECLLYARTPVTQFLDVGTGTGLLLDALATYLPASKQIFHGVELFPPPTVFRSKHPNYHVGTVRSLGMNFQAGTCIEVIEHLTPTMLKALAQDLAGVSDTRALYIFNTGLTKFVKAGNKNYIDPLKRGHICIWSIKSVRKIFEPFGFSIMPIPGKSWAFVAEYRPTSVEADIRHRVWSAVPSNKGILHDTQMGSVLYCLGIDTTWGYSEK